MRPGLRIDLPLRPLLNAIVSDGRGRVERLGNVLLGQLCDVARADGVAGPHAGEAVRLELDRDRRASGARLPGPCPLERAREVLDVVAVLVRQDVCLGEVAAARAETGAELIEEPQVEVDALVERTVERPDLGAREPATGLRRTREERRPGLPIAGAGRGPLLLDAVHGPDDPALASLVRVRARTAVGERLGR